MPFNRTKQKVAELNQRPEEERHITATRLMFIIGLSVVIIWLAILLPLQLFLNRQLRSSDSSSSANVAAPADQNRTDELLLPQAASPTATSQAGVPAPDAAPQ